MTGQTAVLKLKLQLWWYNGARIFPVQKSGWSSFNDTDIIIIREIQFQLSHPTNYNCAITDIGVKRTAIFMNINFSILEKKPVYVFSIFVPMMLIGFNIILAMYILADWSTCGKFPNIFSSIFYRQLINHSFCHITNCR